jgi:hypothetical protein
LAWKVRGRRESDDDFQQRIGEYNRECRLVKIDYRNGRNSNSIRGRIQEPSLSAEEMTEVLVTCTLMY